ncbi:hypothetical protein GGE45_001972 [Rhizobium aethiopicum]|uniref:Uncharacterized protein n=1 Tax=Rhizobium aethiopicum TaxID=1138170 RepID=A0A7W6Q8V6_9HYPH|nr:hypothetical protein [Rhizobium aethiopicum]MBB4192409.1 hypothetical protein [Rhizobium aethiopicum]MBB4579647.1 hypothetical protein [Rhizobium aethiopicum]
MLPGIGAKPADEWLPGLVQPVSAMAKTSPSPTLRLIESSGYFVIRLSRK